MVIEDRPEFGIRLVFGSLFPVVLGAVFMLPAENRQPDSLAGLIGFLMIILGSIGFVIGILMATYPED